MAFFFLEIKCASNSLILLHLSIKCTTSFSTTPSVHIILKKKCEEKTSMIYTPRTLLDFKQSAILLHNSQEKMIH